MSRLKRIFVDCIVADQVSEQESSIVNVDGARTEILMLKQNPDSHLAFVILVTDAIEVIVHDLIKVVLLHRLQFSQCLFVLLLLLFALQMNHHCAFLALEDFSEEFALASEDFAHLVELVVPVFDETRVVNT